ncbi:MAG TPA: hypothetical protein VD772_06015, partial [Anseongella sp.]|nr:hypothetical protein [Anseongella sp.]
MKKLTFSLAAIIAWSIASAQQAAESLWPGRIYKENEFIPMVTFYHPQREKALDLAVVVCPGGGYSGLAMDHEGKQVAEWLNGLGVTAAVLKYHTVSETGG